MQQQIEAKLAAALSPSHLEVINESYMHRVAPGSESHFKVVVVSQAFEGQRLLGRHRQVNGVLAEELAGAIHALALHTYTEQEWQQREQAPTTPSCVSKNGPPKAIDELITQSATS
ncbi:TPA: BolA family protein [Aeromonas hydrophila]